jgi:hypothetical protein
MTNFWEVEKMRALIKVRYNPQLPIRCQLAANPLSLEANWKQITYGSGLGKANYIWKQQHVTYGSEFSNEEANWKKLHAIPLILCLARIRGYYLQMISMIGRNQSIVSLK